MSWLISQALMQNYENSRSSQALAVESLAVTCLDGELSAPSSGSPTPQAFCAPDKMTEFSRLSRFGMTYAPLTEDLGEELLMSYRAGFPARTYQPLGGGKALQDPAAASGKKWHALLAKYDLDTCLWKTAQCSLLADLEQFLETWPRWGSMRNGACYQQPMLARRTSEKESGFWATPTTMDKLPPKSAESLHREATINRPGRSKPANLRDQVSNMQNWPTPSATDGTRGGVMTENMTGQSLTQVVNTLVRFPTPCASDHKGSGKTGTLRDRLDYAAEDWCRTNGVSVGCGEKGKPRGLLRGDFAISKWRNMNASEIAALDGRMTGDMRDGPVIIEMTKEI